MKSAVVFSSLILSAMVAQSTVAQAQESSNIRSSGEIEMSCRIKAKEVAAETYRGCVTEQKNGQIEQIKKEYAAKLQALKAHYEQELKKMNSSKTKAEDSSESAAPIEKVDSAATKTPTKKSKAASSPKKLASKKTAAVARTEVTEMTVQLKQSPGTPETDESMMDLPEPIPVEDVPLSESSI